MMPMNQQEKEILKFFLGGVLTSDELEAMYQAKAQEQPRMTELPETTWKAMPTGSASGDK